MVSAAAAADASRQPVRIKKIFTPKCAAKRGQIQKEFLMGEKRPVSGRRSGESGEGTQTPLARCYLFPGIRRSEWPCRPGALIRLSHSLSQSTCEVNVHGLAYCMDTGGGDRDKERVQTERVAIGEPVWVQCDGFRCLAYLDHRGEWRTFCTNAILTDVVKVLSRLSHH